MNEELLIFETLQNISATVERIDKKMADLYELSRPKTRMVEDGPLKIRFETYQEPLDKPQDKDS